MSSAVLTCGTKCYSASDLFQQQMKHSSIQEKLLCISAHYRHQLDFSECFAT